MNTYDSPFKFCPACAQPTRQPDPREFRCGACGFRYFHNVAAAAGAFIVHGGQLLLTRRAHAPAAGTLDLPGGFVDPHESLEEALVRELDEELGWRVSLGTPRYLFSVANLYEFAGVTYATSDCFFRIDCATRPTVLARDDVAEVLWMALHEIDAQAIGLLSVRAAMEKFLAEQLQRE